jgi:hypothetical protein
MMTYLIKLKALIMKKFLVILIASIGISFYLSAQSAGDYRSVGNGNWNDPTKWERYNGNSWANTTTYPGQNTGTGKVTIMSETEIKITETVSHPVTTLFVIIDDPNILPPGLLTFSSETAVSLTVSGDVIIAGELRIENKNEAKTHTLIIGRSCYVYTGFPTMNGDDKPGVTFNSTDPNIVIEGGGISFHDLTFNYTGTLLVNTNIYITGTVTFINGIVRFGMKDVYNDYPDYAIMFLEGATVSGGSNASYILGRVAKFGSEPFTFPMGDNGFYAPITISGLAGESEIHATYSRNSGASASSITDPELFSVNGCEWWGLNYSMSTGNYDPFDVTVGWTSATLCDSSTYISDVADVVLTTGFSHGGTGTGTTTNGSVTWSGFTGGNITLGNVGTNCRIPMGLNATNITSNSATINWSALPGAVTYDVDYYSNNSSAWINAATGITSTSFNLSGLSPLVTYFCRVRANCSSASSSYRQGQFTTLQTPPPPPPPVCNDVHETNNTSSQARTINLGSTVSAGVSSATDIDWFKITTPNNPNTNLVVTLSNLPADYDLYVYNKSLRLIGSSVSSGTSNEVVIYNSSARKATYYIKIVGKNGAYNTSQCYNLLAQVSSTASSASGKSAPTNEVIDISDKQLLYPNPASEFVHFRFNSAIEGPVDVQIFNTAGQLIKQSAIKINKGYNQVQIRVHDIMPGIYVLRINKWELNMMRKFVIAR